MNKIRCPNCYHPEYWGNYLGNGAKNLECKKCGCQWPEDERKRDPLAEAMADAIEKREQNEYAAEEIMDIAVLKYRKHNAANEHRSKAE